MATTSRIAKRSTAALAGFALLTLALAVGPLRGPLLSLLDDARGGSLTADTWVPARTLRGAPIINRVPPGRSATDSGKSPPIEFLGAQSDLGGEAGACLSFPSPISFLLSDLQCSLTTYAESPINLTIAVVAETFQECADSRLGVSSSYHVVDQTAAGVYYVAMAWPDGFFASQNSITVGIANSSLTKIASSTSYATPGTPATLTSADLNSDGNPNWSSSARIPTPAWR